jgi:hypothetical protein
MASALFVASCIHDPIRVSVDSLKPLLDAGKFDIAAGVARRDIGSDGAMGNTVRAQLAKYPGISPALARRFGMELEAAGSLQEVESIERTVGYGRRDGVLSESDFQTLQPQIEFARVREQQKLLTKEEERLLREQQRRATAIAAIESRRRQAAEAVAAKDSAIFRCKGAEQCDRAFLLAQLYVARNADAGIQVATSSLVETRTPEAGKIGMTVVRSPMAGDESQIRLTVTCRVGDGPTLEMRSACTERETSAYRAFAPFVQSGLTR